MYKEIEKYREYVIYKLDEKEEYIVKNKEGTFLEKKYKSLNWCKLFIDKLNDGIKIRIRDDINEKEYKKLMTFIRGSENFRDYKKLNLLRCFCFLYYSGLRLNEVRELRYKDVYELLENGIVKIYVSKTNSERKIYLSEDFKKELLKLFSILKDKNEFIIYNDRKKISTFSNISFINEVNKIIKEVLGNKFSSHSFRGGLISEMGRNGVNVKMIKEFIGHKNVITTMRYMKFSDDDIMKNLVR